MLRKNTKNLIYFLIIAIPFFLFFSRFEWVRNLSSSVIGITSAPLKLITIPLFEIKKILYYHRTFNEYRRLNKEVDVLRSRLIAQQELVDENSRLTKLLGLKRQLVYSSMAASVIGRNPSYWNSSLIIDKGTKDGIRPGMAVVNSSGVVGKISETRETTSKVVLVTDPGFSVAALVERPRETVLVSGTLQGLCRVRYIDQQAEINLGDLVVTSQLSNSFPEGLMVGEIVSLAQGEDHGVIEYFLKPSVAISHLDEVLVIMK